MAFDSSGREHAQLAEHVAPLRQPFARHGRDHLARHQVHVLRAAGAVVHGILVGAHEGGRQADGLLLRQLADGAQHLQLGLDVQAVAALHLGRGRAVREHRRQARARGRHQLVLGGGARGGHRLDDAAASGGDLRVGGARQPALQLVAAIAREHQVRVGIDEAGHHRAARGRRSRWRPACSETACRHSCARPTNTMRPPAGRPTRAGWRRCRLAPGRARGAGPAHVATRSASSIRKSAVPSRGEPQFQQRRDRATARPRARAWCGRWRRR